MQDKIRSQFDETLARHLERLIGTREGISGLPLNIATIGCLVLLAERELEIENVPSDAPERYTHHTLLSDAADVGIKSDDYLGAALQALTERGYVEVGEDGRLLTRKPVLSMARLFNVVFPRMPGMSFLAYAGQALDEVLTDRAEFGSALDRFDQTLKMHGVSPGKQKSETGPGPRRGSNGGNAAAPAQGRAARTAGTDQQKSRLSREEILLKMKERVVTARPSPVEPPSMERPRTASERSVPAPDQHHVVPPQETPRPAADERIEVKKEESPDQPSAPAVQDPQTDALIQDMPAEAQAAAVPAEEEDLVRGEPATASGVASGDTADSLGDERPPPLDTTEEQNDGLYVADQDEPMASEEEAIAKKISAFENRLSLVCPMCKTHELKEKSTAAGKMFYVCSDEVCGFISWGKPHHIECARCKNPFMVEAVSATGEKILKCPRATCQYRRSLNPARKVVRRRVVRRK